MCFNKRKKQGVIMMKQLISLFAVAGLAMAFSGAVLAAENQTARDEPALHQSMPVVVSSSAPVEKQVESAAYTDIDPMTTGSRG
ncbi:MAG: Hypothetical protein BHV28_09360 [Candidatus Tokpelaia hoelldobleri]|uniref:Uncharacterized protein n=1 Tax=Candidatus Tokpelaia hoelldobleri TaxID=1902579 RepID=A0A1U9JUS9_9HYPH|nr:MAG: Hypothetical protein BHV28_09360 [Candidatus Tokpelaia hoelldoblerii]